MTLDRDLQSIQEVRDLVANAKKAQRELAEFSQEKIDRIIYEIAKDCAANAQKLARRILRRKNLCRSSMSSLKR